MMMFDVVLILMGVLLSAVVGYAIGGVSLALVLLLAVLSVALAYHLYHLYHLHTWLKSTDQLSPSATSNNAFGLWRSVFGILSEQAKSREKRKQKLAHTVARLNRMIAAIPSAVMIVNEDGHIEWKNALADGYFGLHHYHKKMTLAQAVDIPVFHDFLDNALSLGGVSDVKMQLNQKTLLLTLIPIEAKANMLIAHDISASEQLNVSKNAFVANVSHELRTPLTVIGGFLETMQDTPDLPSDLQDEFVALMKKESERMLDLVEGLLTLSRLENDGFDQDGFEAIDLSALAQGIAQDAKTLSQNHVISSDIAPNVWVSGIYKELYSALSNLAFNAVRHTPDGTKVHISLMVQDGENGQKQVKFAVKDTGDGIEEHHLRHLTERFYRVDKGRSRKTGGSGLGLAITKHALARHQATLQIDSTVGVGSVFSTVFDTVQR